MNDNAYMLRHFLAALAYRFQKTLKDAPADFATFEAGHEVRTPLAIVGHMNGVLGFAKNVLASGDEGRVHVPEQSFEKQIDLLHQILKEIDTRLLSESYETELLERLLQGPLADAMTHVGQLATLRRMAGSPIKGENFFAAAIETRRVEQEEAVNSSEHHS